MAVTDTRTPEHASVPHGPTGPHRCAEDGCTHQDPLEDHGRWGGVLPSWTPPLVVGLLGIGACILLAVRDPNEPGSWGYCPSQALLGIDCPGCGILRGTHALTQGDVATAVNHNIIILPVLGLIAFAYLRWAGSFVGIRIPQLALRTWMIWTAAAVVGAFWVLRNLGGTFEFLASTAG